MIKKQKQKKNKWIDILIVLLIVFVFIGGIVYNIIYNMNNYALEFYQIYSDKIVDRMRIVYVSDLHLREYGKNNNTLVNDIEKLKPDLILLGGDLVTDKVNDYSVAISFCEQISEIAPVYGVLGNHETVKIFHQDEDTLVQSFTEAGVHVLRNESATVSVNDTVVRILGIEGNSASFEKYGAKEFMQKEAIEDSPEFTICLTHIPAVFVDVLNEYKFDLGLAGHTHGGIIRLPKIGGLYSNEEGFLPEYDSGGFTLDNGSVMIISRGLGSSSVIPRINNTPELTVVDINK